MIEELASDPQRNIKHLLERTEKERIVREEAGSIKQMWPISRRRCFHQIKKGSGVKAE